ncbi:hypothetical protein Pmani_013130 [Petrolisthes manimaculis]|uniref:Fibrinogen C-terminal domain-containing protein n=1 Tax=Petrolisthes manimaculis TaxID=1843537 RepID=A0AAE1PWK7_9EUCA|nr:hypothetical protein Pmani_013130 [Petrolisthes manimaculis]
MEYHNGMEFSTYDDEDNDGASGGSCSEWSGGGGWWYNFCFYSNPTGVYPPADLPPLNPGRPSVGVAQVAGGGGGKDEIEEWEGMWMKIEKEAGRGVTRGRRRVEGYKRKGRLVEGGRREEREAWREVLEREGRLVEGSRREEGEA